MIEKFTRTFHPVGHGAFYTETIVSNQRTYNIVYDCGAKAFSRVGLEDQVKKAFDTNTIDLLFISHFHSDHINGIEYLISHYHIRKVVMPLLDDTAKVLAQTLLLLSGGDTAIINDPQSYFGNDTRIIQVNPVSDNIQVGEEYVLEDFFDRSEINSGDKILVNADWYYIPYNYKYDERRAVLSKLLAKAGIDINSLDLKKARTAEVMDIYESVTGNHNLYSLILYSGNEKTKLITCNKKFCYERRFWRSHSGCLYLGDTNLNQENIVNDIKKRLSSLWRTVSTIQIPHHGAEPNYNPAIISSYLKFAVVSCKEGDRLHPSNNVVNDFNHSTGRHLFKVTEEKESIVTQFKR